MLGQPMLASFARQCDNHVFQEPVARFKVRKIFVHNSWSFWVNPLKFGDFSKNLVWDEMKFKIVKICKHDNVIGE